MIVQSTRPPIQPITVQRAPVSWTESASVAFARGRRFSADGCHVGGPSAAAGKAIVQADRSRTESRDLKQTTRHHDVFEEVDHLILVGEVAVERGSGREAEHCQRDCDRTNLISSN